MTSPSPEVHEALHDLGQYLSDVVAPLIVVDAVTLLASQPPQFTAAEIQNWTLLQYRGQGQGVPVSDYLFHALKKLHVLGEFGLVAKDDLLPWLEQVARLLYTFCPESDREFFTQNVKRLALPGQPTGAAPVAYIHRQMGTEARLASTRDAPPAPPAPAPAWVGPVTLVQAAPGSAVGPGAVPVALPAGAAAALPVSAAGVAVAVPAVAAPVLDAARTSRLLELLLERLERESAARAGAALATSPGEAGHILAAVASASPDDRTLSRELTRLRDFGIAADLDQVFRQLSESLPAWSAPGDPSAAAPPARSASADAMHRIIALAENPTEAAHRLHEMVKAAVAQFNAGSAERAVAMYELAEQVVSEQKIKPAVVEALRRNGHEALDKEKLRDLARAPDKRRLAHKVMSFYFALRPEGLLDQLQLEPRREKRRALIELLEAHGPAGRPVVLDLLVKSLTGSAARDDWHFQRNLVHLLRRVPRPPAEPAEREVEPVASLLDAGRPLPLLKECVAHLAQARHEKAEQALVRAVARFEEAVLALEPGSEADEIRTVLDRLVAALARLGTPGARRAAVNHGLRKEPRLGDTLARLDDLAGQDFSGDRALIDRLMKALEDELPRRILGVQVKAGTSGATHLVRALSGSSAEPARAILRRVADMHPDEGVAEEARRALVAPPAPPPAPAPASSPALPAAPAFTGDLGLFGLPNLLSSLATTGVSGDLVLRQGDKVVARIRLREGGFVGAACGALQGADAVCQLIERPFPAGFAFVAGRVDSARTPGNVQALLMDAVRRHDELEHARVLLPDGAALRPTAIPHSIPAHEKDAELVEAVWTRAASGARALDCERDLRADSLRVRRLLVHWLTEGSLLFR